MVELGYLLQEVSPLECEEVVHDGLFHLLESLAGCLLLLLGSQAGIVHRLLFQGAIPVVHEVHGHTRHALVGVREEVTFGPEPRFGVVCHGLVEHGLEDGHGE